MFYRQQGKQFVIYKYEVSNDLIDLFWIYLNIIILTKRINTINLIFMLFFILLRLLQFSIRSFCRGSKAVKLLPNHVSILCVLVQQFPDSMWSVGFCHLLIFVTTFFCYWLGAKLTILTQFEKVLIFRCRHFSLLTGLPNWPF